MRPCQERLVGGGRLRFRPKVACSAGRAVCAAALAGLLLACGGDTVAGRPVERLLDAARDAELRWPGGAGKDRPAAFAPARGIRPGAPRRLARLAMKRGDLDVDQRAALVAPAGSRYRFRLRLPEDAELRLGLGYAMPATSPAALSLGFRISVAAVADGDPAVVLEEVVPVRTVDGWRDRAVDLGKWGGSEVVMELAVFRPGRGAAATRRSPDEPLLWGAWGAPEIVDAAARVEGWDVILISLDTLRADHLGCYGYERPTSPRIDTLAAEGVRFAAAVSPSPWTRPAHYSLFTGVYPLSRGGLTSPPLARELRRAGHRTAAFTGGGQLDFRMGFDRGFDEYRLLDWIREPEAVVEWMESTRGRNRFLFLHTYEIHDPYVHAELAAGMPRGRLDAYFDRWTWERMRHDITPAEAAYIEALYDGGIAFTDRRLGILLDRLEQTGALERAILVVTSDHGEQFFEHGAWRHGHTLYDHQLLVPLIVRLPPDLARRLGVVPGAVIDEQVQLTDLYPTVLDLLGIPLAHRVHGRSLAPLLAGGSLPRREAFAEDVNVKAVERKALRTRRWKYVHTFPKPGAAEGAERIELYDLQRDPGETVNMAGDLPDQAASFEALLQLILGSEAILEGAEPAPEELDPELRKRLEALGYIGD